MTGSFWSPEGRVGPGPASVSDTDWRRRTRFLRDLFRGEREDDSDLARLQRIGCRFVGCGLLLFCALMAPVALARADLTAAWWTPVSVALVAGPAVAMVMSTLLDKPRHLELLAAGCATGFMLATLLWLSAWRGEPDEDARWAVWMLQFPSVPSFALVIMSQTRLALAALVTNTFLVHTANQVARHGEIRPVELLSAPLSIALAGVFLTIAIATVQNVKWLDDRHPVVLEQTAASAANAAQEAERARFAALIHDRVIATLLAVRAGPADSRLATQARSALHELDRSITEPATLDAAGFVARIRSAATATSEEVCFFDEVSGGGDYSTDLADVLSDCVGEATRNWYRHAGAGSRCDVRMVIGELSVRIDVIDDGAGFDPESVDARRFGIAGGIRGRMARLPGGVAHVHSAPGHGTVVSLEWRRP